MPPKKKQQQNQKSGSTSKNKAQSSGPKLQISAENENRLRRLLLDSGRSTAAPVQEDSSLTKAQKVKKLHSVYEKLSCEGFTDDHIERALSHLKESATFESALDWLCLVLPPNEFPLKFRNTTSFLPDDGGSVGIISTARDDWAPLPNSTVATENEMPQVSIKIKEQRKVDTLDSFRQSQADWIRQYMEQQEEEEYESWEDVVVDKASEPRSYEIIREEYHSARLQAINAKERKDKKGQEQSGQIIRKLKQEMASLGISVDTLSAEFESCHRVIEDKKIDSAICNEDDCVDSFVKPVTAEHIETVTGNISEDISIQGDPNLLVD